MINEKRAYDVAQATNILPKLMHYFSSSFKPCFEMPIKKNEVRTIIELYYHPGKPMKHYIDSVDMESGSFTYLADKLEKKGIIKRTPSKNDKRVNVLELTDKGKMVAKKLNNNFTLHISHLIKDLDDEDLKEMEEAIKSLEKVYEKLNLTNK
ncbi:MAG: MarR family winged helix-turn-helix transcriptional regulator [Sphaerochaetaceae bacterium]|nr:MarR family winged helix-turn-helix transcriptional regulator [Sphaerochaetaceae bacterium]